MKGSRSLLVFLSAVAPLAAQTGPAETVAQYCVTCHNAKLKTGGLVLDPADLNRAGATSETWEKVVRKLHANAMPPLGARQPGPEKSAALVSYLEGELDRNAAANPRAGKLPLLHRLSRTEYQNAIRDLLDLGPLPKELDYSFLLPADNISSGFDNIADLLFLSPSTMERYMDAARKISRFAVGDPKMPALVNIYRMDTEHPQDERVEDLPFGTRGGLAIHSEFPVDGTYGITVELASAPREAHQIEITMDGERVQLATVGGESSGGGRRAAATKPLEFRIPMKAGRKLIGVSFIQHDEGYDEATLKPRLRSRGTQPAIAQVTVTGPYDVRSPGESPSRKRIFECHPESASEESDCAKRILLTLARRAFRRPVTTADLDDLMPFYTTGRAEAGFDRGIEKALERLLVSPQFLFRIEREPAGLAAGKVYPLTDLELASRLSFFLWSSIPDDELLDAAAAGRLKHPGMLERQVHRMLADPRADSMITNFAAQWLYLRDIQAKQPDEILFPDFDETLRQSMETETELFVGSILHENRSVLDLIGANYTFLNERLAKHYGVPNIKGSYFRRVTFPESSPRGGLLGQGSALTLTSYSIRTSPVLRGKYVLENLLSAAPPPPPPNVPSLKREAEEPGKTLTMREAMTQHRANPACAGCHARMDPIGFAMENFNAVGEWRERDGESTIDASGVFPDGTKFDGIAGLKKELLSHPEQIVNTVTERLLMYGIGRNLQSYDAPAVRAIVRGAKSGDYTFEALITVVVKSEPFQFREARGSEAKAR